MQVIVSWGHNSLGSWGFGSITKRVIGWLIPLAATLVQEQLQLKKASPHHPRARAY